MIIDTFSFFNEFDLLEIRLNSLASYVDKFVLVENPYTFTGHPKPLYFQENKDRFKDFNITHLIVENQEQFLGKSPWDMEFYQWNYLMNGITDADPEDIILISGLDEIPDLSLYKGQEGVFPQKRYYYYLNCYSGKSNWRGTVAVKKKHISTIIKSLTRRAALPFMPFPGGWHFSTIGRIEQILYKVESYSHQELNTKEFRENLPYNLCNLIDPFCGYWPGKNRKRKLMIEMPDGPQYLLDNKEKYQHMFYGEI